MKGYIWPPQCYICSKLMSYKSLEDAISWIPFGGCTDTDPPDEEYAHKECWAKAGESNKELVKLTSWIPPNETLNS